MRKLFNFYLKKGGVTENIACFIDQYVLLMFRDQTAPFTNEGGRNSYE